VMMEISKAVQMVLPMVWMKGFYSVEKMAD
jgi:hypothetical protein